MRDFTKLQNDPPNGITASPINDDLMQWEAVIFG
jgi:ubiquitin-conjugating enzyme E2 A